MSAETKNLWRETPLIYSNHLSDRLDSHYEVYLKLEVSPFLKSRRRLLKDVYFHQTLQPAQSFKSRGISHFIRKQVELRGDTVHIICASGGNAGLAAAAASQVLGVKCTIYLPEGVDIRTRNFLTTLGAEIVVAGAVYGEALVSAEKAVTEDDNA
jgi:L-serine/L-threonine ammonia-lyase